MSTAILRPRYDWSRIPRWRRVLLFAAWLALIIFSIIGSAAITLYFLMQYW